MCGSRTVCPACSPGSGRAEERYRVPPRPRRGRSIARPQRPQPDRTATEQGQRVEVDVPPEQSPVQARLPGTPPVTARQASQRGTRRDEGSHLRRRGHRLVRRPEPVVVPDHGNPPAGHCPGERDDTGADGAHHRVRCRPEVHATVPGSVGGGRRLEEARDRGCAVQRPAESRRCRPRGGRHQHGGEQAQQYRQRQGWGSGEGHGATVPGAHPVWRSVPKICGRKGRLWTVPVGAPEVLTPQPAEALHGLRQNLRTFAEREPHQVPARLHVVVEHLGRHGHHPAAARQ
jgi:hypothetical protein